MTSLLWITAGKQPYMYTHKVLRWWFQNHGGTTAHTTDQKPDLVCASICSPNEINLLAKARKVADSLGVPLLVGGPEAYNGATYLAFADYLNVGEGFQLLADLARSKDPVGTLKDAPNVLNRSDPHREVKPNYWIPWEKLPLVQIDKKAHNFLAGRGCHRKCRFCFTSWTQPYTHASAGALARARRALPPGGIMTYVTNDGGIGSGAASTTVRQYLNDRRTDWPPTVRLGVEGISEQRRKWLGKPISDQDLARAIIKAKLDRIVLELFCIVGFADDPEPAEAADTLTRLIGLDTARFPQVAWKFTWFEPAPHTPLARWDVRQLTPWDFRAYHDRLCARSARARIFPAGPIGRSAWAAIMQRAPMDAAVAWGRKHSAAKGWTVAQVCAKASDICGAGVLDGSQDMPWQRVRVDIKTGRMKRLQPAPARSLLRT